MVIFVQTKRPSSFESMDCWLLMSDDSVDISQKPPFMDHLWRTVRLVGPIKLAHWRGPFQFCETQSHNGRGWLAS